jgi:hypothetical protein
MGALDRQETYTPFFFNFLRLVVLNQFKNVSARLRKRRVTPAEKRSIKNAFTKHRLPSYFSTNLGKSWADDTQGSLKPRNK